MFEAGQLGGNPGIIRGGFVPAGQGFDQASLQFGGGGFGERDNEESIQGDRRLGGQGEMQDALNEGVGLARACARHDQDVALGGYGGLLLFCQLRHIGKMSGAARGWPISTIGKWEMHYRKCGREARGFYRIPLYRGDGIVILRRNARKGSTEWKIRMRRGTPSDGRAARFDTEGRATAGGSGMSLPDFSSAQWGIVVLAALCVGVNKSGLPGLSLLHVAAFAWLFPGQASTGIVLPMLVAGDVGAVLLYRRQAEWGPIWRTLPVALGGVILGWLLMKARPHADFRRIIGGVVLVLVLIQWARYWRPAWFAGLPHSRPFAWVIGAAAGVTTMVANAAGPIMGIFFLLLDLGKQRFVGTMSWFFLILNLCKLPFSWDLGLIRGDTLVFNAILVPLIIAGLFLGRWLIAKLPQKLFDTLVLAMAALASLKLLLG